MSLLSPGGDVSGVDGRRPDPGPLLLTVLGAPLRLPPLLALAPHTVALAFTDNPAECAAADVVLVSDPPDGDVHEVREHAPDTPLLVIVPRRTSERRIDRLRRAGADACLRDPEHDELAACLDLLGTMASPLRGEA